MIGNFHTIIKDSYNELIVNFKYAAYNHGLKYDYDVFADTYDKCHNTLINKNIKKDDAIRYFWASFSNNLKRLNKKTKYTPTIVDLNENCNQIIDTEYNETKFQIADIIKSKIINKFGKKSFDIWYLHFIDGKTYEELIDMGYDNINFHNLFRQIRYYIKITLPNEEPEFKKLLEDSFYI